MLIHILKLQFQFCDLVESGVKSFEIRKMDRDFHTGDLIKFHPINQSGMASNISKAMGNAFVWYGNLLIKEGESIDENSVH